MKETDKIGVMAIRLLPKGRSLRAFSPQDMEGIEPGDFPIYEWQEIQQLIDDQVEPEMLRTIHNTKRIFPGTIVICEKK